MSTPGKSYRCCFVPLCKNTTKSTPHKVFFCVPRDEKMRKLWFRQARRPDNPSQWNYFCCQDHFNIKDDMENYVRFMLMGGPVKLKLNVVPHIFNCQPDRERAASRQLRPVAEKRRHKAEIADILANPGCSSQDVSESKSTEIWLLHQ
ncbi:PREDICTED: uncharacterized protein LOC105557065 [Vollenhovia emeryi]|uniref:uncharacterized protein LOC105557065 n=1 Tax=Vollenhovia emeryi TaxID=411798 RepID=UPI0005F3F2E6|nr:PREDICTED: uncharacterized protein LOC105557065 [Vollenhovia emeryi]